MNLTAIREPARDLPVRAAYDVVVCGGGLGGAAAASGTASALRTFASAAPMVGPSAASGLP